jgi:hypothetical protein
MVTSFLVLEMLAIACTVLCKWHQPALAMA